jgi:hypothetical protein
VAELSDDLVARLDGLTIRDRLRLERRLALATRRRAELERIARAPRAPPRCRR